VYLPLTMCSNGTEHARQEFEEINGLPSSVALHLCFTVRIIDMKNILFSIIFIHLVFWSCQSTTDNQNEEYICNPSENNLNFIFRYGIGETKNNLNTFNCSFTKDMVCDPPITISLEFSSIELDSIYNYMLAIEFFNLPDTFIIQTQDTLCYITPYSTFYFYVVSGNKTKELYWQDDICDPDPKKSEIIQLIDIITGIVKSRDEYISLPQPGCGYD